MLSGKSSRRWLVVVLAAGLALAVTGGTALAAGWVGLRDLLGLDREALRAEREAGKSLAQIAGEQGIDEEQLVGALLAGLRARLDLAVTAGRLSREEADRVLADAEARVREFLNRTDLGPGSGKFGAGWGGRWKGHGAFPSVGCAELSDLLGLDREALRAELKAGKSLARIAAERGVSEERLVEALLAGLRARLDAAVTAGKLSREQADRILADSEARAREFINRTDLGPAGGKFGRGWGGRLHGRHPFHFKSAPGPAPQGTTQ